MSTKKQLMTEALNYREQIIDEDFALEIRIDNAKKKIIELQEEAELLKIERPKLLADCKDITKLTSRLKEIDEEIAIQKDTIIGITAKRENMKNDIFNAKQDANIAFQEYIKEILESVKKEYMQLAPKFAKIITEYITLEYIRYGMGRVYVPDINYDDISKIPNFNDENKPLFKHEIYKITSDNDKKVREKYNIPDYQVQNRF